MEKIYFFLFLIVIAVQTACAGNNSNLPVDLLIEAQRHDCSPIVDFFDRPGMVPPPYVYGVLGGVKENSVAFWCQSSNDKNQYKLVITDKMKNTDFDCSSEILTTNYPGGLSTIDGSSELLKNFSYLNKREVRVSAVVDGVGPFISSYYDGVESIYYCNEGDWLVQYKH